MYRNRDVYTNIFRDFLTNVIASIFLSFVMGALSNKEQVSNVLKDGDARSYLVAEALDTLELWVLVLFCLCVLSIYANWNSKIQTPYDVCSKRRGSETYSWAEKFTLPQVFKSRHRVGLASLVILLVLVGILTYQEATDLAPFRWTLNLSKLPVAQIVLG